MTANNNHLYTVWRETMQQNNRCRFCKKESIVDENLLCEECKEELGVGVQEPYWGVFWILASILLSSMVFFYLLVTVFHEIRGLLQW